MASRKKKNQDPSDLPPDDVGSTELVLTPEHMKMIESLVYHVLRIKHEQESLAEDVKGVAQKINIKPGEVKEMVGWIIQEREKGGVLSAKEKKLEFVRQVLSFIDGDAAES